MAELIVRRMRNEDSAEVVRLALQLGYECTNEDIQRRVSTLSDQSQIALLVAELNGKVVGWATVNRERQTLLSEGNAELSAIVVDETVRGKSVGSALLNAAEVWAKGQGLTLMRLRTNVKRTDAHVFYEKNGYELVKSWHLFTKKL